MRFDFLKKHSLKCALLPISSLILCGQLEAQEGRNNLSLGLDAGGSGGSALLAESRDLLGMVVNSAAGSTIGGRITIQEGVISALPSYISRVDNLYRRNYGMEKPLSGGRFNAWGKYVSPHSILLVPLEVDPADMEIEVPTWFQFKGIDAKKPTSSFGISYDTNSSNQPTSAESDSLIQTTRLNLPFTYGAHPGSSTIVNLVYQPAYLLNLMGPGGNEIEHEIIFQAGRAFHRSALGFNNQTTISSAPLRELAGRSKSFVNQSSILGAYDVSPKTLIRYGGGHSVSTRSDTASNNEQTITIDEARLSYELMLSPKISQQGSLDANITQLANQNTLSESLSLGFSYAATAKMTLSLSGGYLLRHPPDQATEESQLFGFIMEYSATAKTVLSFEVANNVRPSFADEGIFLRENSFIFQIRKAVLLRWQVEFLIDYIIREENNSLTTTGLKQNDLRYELNMIYLMSDTTTIEFSASRFQLTDLTENIESNRLNVAVSWNHAF